MQKNDYSLAYETRDKLYKFVILDEVAIEFNSVDWIFRSEKYLTLVFSQVHFILL